MKNDIDIGSIECLLHRYYRADTSPEEEASLEDFFSETDVADLPDNMVADRELFSLLRGLHDSPSGSEVPEALARKMELIAASGSTDRRSRILAFLRYSGVAAAVAMIAVLFTVIPRFAPGAEAPASGSLIAAAEVDGYSSVEEDDDFDAVFIDIDDPEEAGKIVQEIASLLVWDIDVTSDAIAQISRTIDEYNQISKSILQ